MRRTDQRDVVVGEGEVGEAGQVGEVTGLQGGHLRKGKMRGKVNNNSKENQACNFEKVLKVQVRFSQNRSKSLPKFTSEN